MKIKDFIEKGIQGGWTDGMALLELVENLKTAEKLPSLSEIVMGHALLNPNLWEGVAKVEGWRKVDVSGDGGSFQEGHLFKMYRMIDHLAEGKDVESYIETL